MRENFKLIIGLLIIFGIIAIIFLVVYIRLGNAIEYDKELDNALIDQRALVADVEKAKQDSQTYNQYTCDPSIVGDTKNDARCIVETRTKEQQTSYEQILEENNFIVNSPYKNQSQTGFSDGIYGQNNFANQYNVSGTIEDNTVYQAHLKLKSTSGDYLRGEVKQVLEQYSLSQSAVGSEFATVLNPQASYQTLEQSELTDGYDNGLLIGSYPEDGSNQVMVSYLLAANICGKVQACNYIDQLLEGTYNLQLTGILPDETTSTITAEVQITGIYYGSHYRNDLLLAYDQMNPSEV